MKVFWPSLGICLGIFVAAMDWSIVNNALPSIQRDLGAKLSELQWMVNALGLVLATTMVTMGRLADAYGRKRLYMIGLLICAITSIGAALSPSAGWLIGFRALQGLFVAITLTTSLSLMTHVFPEEKHGKAMGIYGTLLGLGLSMGPFLGGVIITLASWHWIFYFNIPFLILSGILVKFTVQESKNEEQSVQLDVLGLFLLIVGLGAFITGVIQGPEWGWNNPLILSLFGIAVLFLIFFYFVEQRVSSPLIQFEFFKKKEFFTACIGNFSMVFLWWGLFFSLPLYFQNVLSISVFESGMYMLVMSASFAIASHYAGPIGDKIEKKHLVIGGLFISLIGAFLMTFFTVNKEIILTLVALVFFGLGGGSVFAHSTSLGISAIPRNFAGVASGALSTVQEIGGSMGLALVGTVLRSMEKVRVSIELQKEGLKFSDSMQNKIRSLMSSFEQLQAYLSHRSAEVHEKVLQAFKVSFMFGFHGAIWLCIGVAAVSILSIFLILRKPT